MIIGDVILLADSTALAGDGTVDALLATVAAAVEGGIHTVIVRDKQRPRAERADLCREIQRLVDGDGGVVLAAEDRIPALHDLLPADGVHLSADVRWGSEEVVALADLGVGISQSCHDLDEVVGAADRAATFVTVSPVHPTASKPGYGPALGIDGLASIVAGAACPVVALGGITTPDQVRQCLDAGAAAVAVMGAVLGAEDPAAVAAALAAARDGIPEVAP